MKKGECYRWPNSHREARLAEKVNADSLWRVDGLAGGRRVQVQRPRVIKVPKKELRAELEMAQHGLAHPAELTP